MKLGRALSLLMPATLLVAGVAPWLHLDRWTFGVFLVHPPRPIVGSFMLLWFMIAAIRRQRVIAIFAAFGLLTTLAALGLGPGPKAIRPDSLCLVTCNVGDDQDGSAVVAAVLRDADADLVCLQELRPSFRHQFVTALPEYQFAFPVAFEPRLHQHDVQDSGAFLLHRRLGIDPQALVTESGITGYRTFAVHFSIEGRRISIVNVHATKPIWRKASVDSDTWTYAWRKAQRHVDEHDRLQLWIHSQPTGAMIVAGDFNAPLRSKSASLRDFAHAHAQGGSGIHLTWPSSFPLSGLDHILTNEGVVVSECRTLPVACSDHLAVLSRWSFR